MSGDTPLTRRSLVLGLGAAAGTGLAGNTAARLPSDASTTLTALRSTNITEPSGGDLAVEGVSDWAQFQGSGGKRGVAVGGPSSKALRWEYGEDDRFGYGQPIVADSEQLSSAAVTQDAVYVSVVAIDDPPGGVLALDVEDGTKRWFNTDLTTTKSPIRGAEHVYVGTAALTPDDGSIAWTFEERPGSAVAGDTLYAGGQSLLAIGGD